MGGDANDDWLLKPDSDCITIGTQDMLLSRALNRELCHEPVSVAGGVRSAEFDVLWVFDEVQLMGVRARYIPANAGFQRTTRFVRTSPLRMDVRNSQEDWLSTVDHPAPAAGRVLRLSQSDTMANLVCTSA